MSKRQKTSCTYIVGMADNTFDQVYAHVATGFSDTSAFLRELTLKSMLVLAPKVCAFSNMSFFCYFKLLVTFQLLG